MIALDDWIADVKKRKAKISHIMRPPKRPFRGIKSRSSEESEALGNLVVQNWNNAIKNGDLIKNEDGSYTICANKKRH